MDHWIYKLEKRRNEYNEYVVRCFKNGERYKEGDYHTEDWDDAHKTQTFLQKQNKMAVFGGTVRSE